MRSFFYPSIALMNRLAYTRKFALLGLISLVAIAVVVYSLFASLNQVINHSQKELDGIALIGPISKAVQFTQQHRGLSAAFLGGSETMQGWRASKEKEADDAFNALEEKLDAAQLSGEASENWRQIKASWKSLRENGLNSTVAENFAAHTRLIDQIMLFEVSIIDEYMLTLDTEISTNYLIDTTVNKLPHVIEHLGQIRAYGTGILAKKQISSPQKVEMEIMLAELGNSLQLLNTNIEKSNRYNTVTRDALSAASNAIAESAKQITALVKSDILAERFVTHPEDFMLLATKAIDRGYEQIYKSLLPTTEALIKARIERAKHTLYTSVGIAILLFLIAAYFAVGIYKAITGSIQSLANSARAFASGDLRERANISAHDELSQVGDSFNEMADGFSAMLSKVAHREREILRINTELEDRVLERTEELNKAKAAAESANIAKGDFLANMSHEIRTPMNAIIGLSHLCMQTELSEKQGDYLHKVHGSAKALLGIINDVLDFSKIDAGKMEMEQVRFELEEVMGNLSTVVSSRFEEKGIEFLYETSQDVPQHMIGDPLRLGQVLINLAGNAVKFTERGEVLVLTEVEDETAEYISLRFTVRDSGIGMTQEQSNKLFQAFTQADSTITRKFGGTGLGLSISKQLVSLMHGKIWVESAPGAGSRFIFTARFGKAEERRTEKRHQPDVDLRGMRVLAVDDNATCRHILQAYLKSFSFEEAEAVNGMEALQVIEKADRDGAPFQLVVLDWKMPGMDGIEVARRIHEMAGLSKMPKILLISAFSQNEVLRHLEGHVVDGMLTKPFQQSELFNATVEIFGNSAGSVKRNALTSLFHPDLVGKISGAHLLLAEDNEINQQVARELLEKAGVTVTIAENGKEAIAKLWEEEFDGVLMDVQMPVMDGLSATREIRKNPRLADLPIIAMTANVMTGDREQCLIAGMNDHITKPLDPNQMIVTLAKWITPAKPTAPPTAPGLEVAPNMEALPNLPGVRVDEGVRRMGGNVTGYYSILEKFRNGQQGALAEIRSSIAAEDWKKAERLAHTLKGLLGTLGADKLKEQAAELEAAIRGRIDTKIESLFSALDPELIQLFAAIDRALKLWAAEKMADEVTATTGPVNIEELTNLIRQVKLQLEQFDSSVEDTVAKIRRIVGGDAAMKNAIVSIERHVSGYDYEKGLAELIACAKSNGISCED